MISWEEDKTNVKKLLTALKIAGIMLDPRKTQVGLRRIMFLGMVFDENGMSADQKRLYLSPIQSTVEFVSMLSGME